MSRPSPKTAAPTRRGRWLVPAGVSLLALVAAELGARAFLLPPRYIGVMRYDPELGFRQVPHRAAENHDEFGAFEYRLNDEGFRGRELPEGPAPAGTERLLFVGDSFLNAWAVREEHLMMHAAEERLAERGRAVESYSLCCDDYGTSQELLLLREHGPRVQPDAVVLAFYPNNDLVNNSLALAGRTSNSPGDLLRPYLHFTPEGEERTHYLQPVRSFFRRHSRLFTKLERRLLLAGETHGIDWLRPWPEAPTAHELLEAGRPPRRSLELFRAPAPESEWARAWRSTEDLLCAFRDEVRSQGARFLLLVIPSRAQVQRDAVYLEMDLKTRELAGLPLDELLDWDLPERRLAAFCRSEGIELRALLEPFRGAAREELAGLYVRDGHLSWRGDAVAGRVVAEWFTGDAFVEPPPTEAVPMVPAHWSTSRTLDFTTQMHGTFLANGWSGWRPGASDPDAGWRVDGRASLALPSGDGTWTVSGIVPEGAPTPLRVRFASATRESEEVLGGPGPFELRLEASPADASNAGPQWYRLESDVDGGAELRIRALRFEAR